MTADLTSWQLRLSAHFRELADARDRLKAPVFALEHGLEQTEIAELEGSVRAGLLQAPPSTKHWLVWVVYATELGYEYEGDEYWPTFSAETPGWTSMGSREWLRTQFRKFSREYSGAKPVGRWADQFSIICWPIVHAILPQDLQEDLAEVLYRIRRSFRPAYFEDPALLGREIAANAFTGNSRFQGLTENHLLVGQIAAALVRQDDATRSLVYPPTLRRIASDLERVSRARAWLLGARNAARSAMLHGLALPRGTTREAVEDKAERRILDLSPELSLRAVEETRWEAWLQLPNFTPLLLPHPELRQTLSEARCVVVPSDQRPLPRGQLLFSSAEKKLARWPSPHEDLITLTPSLDAVERIINSHCAVSPGSPWLFKVGLDGVAREIRTKMVRPGRSYVLVTPEPLVGSGLTEERQLDCLGVKATLLNVPAAPSESEKSWLLAQGLVPARAITVWPAGLPVARWDGEGRGTWLAGDPILVGFEADHEVGNITVSDKLLGLEHELGACPAGVRRFLQLPSLPRGTHQFQFDFDSVSGERQSATLEIAVVNPSSASTNDTTTPIVVLLDPIAPALEQLWANEVSVSVNGPLGRLVSCQIRLESRTGEQLLETKTSLQMPLDPSGWRNYFAKNILLSRPSQEAYEQAGRCRIVWDGEELGRYSLTCERSTTPLRWLTRFDSRKGYTLQLIDDSGADTEVSLKRFTFGEPDVPNAVGAHEFDSSRSVSKEGGLYMADNVRHRATALVPPALRRLEELRTAAAPVLRPTVRTFEDIRTLVDLHEFWCSPPPPGNVLGQIRRISVLQTIHRRIFGLIAGERWEQAELEHLADKRPSATKFKQLFLKSRTDRSVRDEVLMAAHGLSSGSFTRAVLELESITRGAAFARVPSAITRSVAATAPTWRAEFALRMACSPAEAKAWAGPDLRYGITILLDHPILAKAARLLVLALGQEHDAVLRISPDIPQGWEWL